MKIKSGLVAGALGAALAGSFIGATPAAAAGSSCSSTVKLGTTYSFSHNCAYGQTESASSYTRVDNWSASTSTYVRYVDVKFGEYGEYGQRRCYIEAWIGPGQGSGCWNVSGWINLAPSDLYKPIPVKATVTYWTGSSNATKNLPSTLAFVDGY